MQEKQKKKIYSVSEEDNLLALEPKVFISKWYRDIYADTTYSGLGRITHNWIHNSLEKGYDSKDYFSNVLEIGANKGEHLPYVKHDFKNYYLTDVLPSLKEGPQEAYNPKNVIFKTVDAISLPWGDNFFDRVLHTCVLHHIDDPEKVLSELRRVLKPGGRADLMISSDPGSLFRLARAIGPIRTAKKMGLLRAKRIMDARDHQNHVGSLRRLVKHVFREDSLREKSYPITGLSWNSSLWLTFRITKNHSNTQNIPFVL